MIHLMFFKNLWNQLYSLKSFMAFRKRFVIVFILVAYILLPSEQVFSQSVGAYDLIGLINGMRSANGLGALSVDSALMACAQSTAETMAASHMTWHIGNVSGRASSFGYNNYNTCFATENFSMGGPGTTISQIAASWSDATHMIPAQSSKYCHIGAGVAVAADGMEYYVVQAAYPAGVNGCGYASSQGNAGGSAGSTGTGSGAAVSYIMAVVTSTPDEKGMTIHTVQEGQTLWAISQAYDVTIEDIQAWNNLYGSTALSLNQALYIPSKDESGRTPTPQVELTIFPTADSRGRFVHVVSEGDTLWSISELWHVPLNSIYQVNGMSAESSIGLGWEIVIPVTATVTPLPTDTPTVTPSPTETESPTESVLEPDVTTSFPVAHSDSVGLLHTPKANTRTYIISAILIMITVGGMIIAVNYLGRKK